MLDSKFVYQKICQENHQGKIIFPESSNLWRYCVCVVCSMKVACVKFTRTLSFQSIGVNIWCQCMCCNIFGKQIYIYFNKIYLWLLRRMVTRWSRNSQLITDYLLVVRRRGFIWNVWYNGFKDECCWLLGLLLKSHKNHLFKLHISMSLLFESLEVIKSCSKKSAKISATILC